MNKDIRKYDSCLSGQKCEEETGTRIPLWYECNQLPQSISKRCWPSAHKRAITQETAVIDNDKPQRLSTAVTKINMELLNIDSDNENNTDSS